LLLTIKGLWIFFALNLFEQELGGRLHIFQHNVPKVRIIDLELVICTITYEAALGERTRPIYQGILGYSRVILDNVIYILLKECLVLIMLTILQESKNAFLQESFHLALG
jgi:hypothetical protein